MIPICLILFILFIAVITFAIKRADSAQAKVTEEFWEKERKANSTLRGDTTDLCYITIPEKFFPLNNDYYNRLKDAGYESLGNELLELAVEQGADSKNVYSLLANAFISMSKADRLAELIEKAKQLNSLSRDGIVSMLESLQADTATDR